MTAPADAAKPSYLSQVRPSCCGGTASNVKFGAVAAAVTAVVVAALAARFAPESFNGALSSVKSGAFYAKNFVVAHPYTSGGVTAAVALGVLGYVNREAIKKNLPDCSVPAWMKNPCAKKDEAKV